MKIFPVILSGGSGSRLWPLSRKQFPKQYLALHEEQTMLQATVKRLDGLGDLAPPIVICNVEHRFLVAEQLNQIGVHDAIILLEPVGRNTAPAIAVAANYIMDSSSGRDHQMLVLSADHVVKDKEAFCDAVEIASYYAAEKRLVTFGVVPTESHTGYGYIEKASELSSTINKKRYSAFEIKQFVEKPNKKDAIKYLNKGNYLWNGGMFLFEVDMVLSQLSKFAPEMVSASQRAVENAEKDLDFVRLEERAFLGMASDSIDYVLMEKTDRGVVVPLDAEWSDVGSWSALYDIGEKDANNNCIKGDVLTQDSNNCHIYADHHMVAAIGVEGLVIVDTPDATLVCAMEKAQEVRRIVEQLKEEDRREDRSHRKVYRPWGWYDTIDGGHRFKVKRICVTPGCSLSLQKHHHRAEHWIIVRGTARITNGDKVELLTENQSTFIPIGVVHRLENPGRVPLEMVEVQSGSYLDEDDIVRIEDRYGR